MSFHSHQAPDCRSQERYMSMAKWPLLLSFPEFGPWCVSAEVNTNLLLTPLKQSVWIRPLSTQVLQACKPTIPHL